MAATVAASEARRAEETRELAAQTAAEWIAGQPDNKLVREAGAIKCGKKGTVEVLELQKEYRQELAKITDGKVLAECCAPLRRAASTVLDDGRDVCGSTLKAFRRWSMASNRSFALEQL